MHGSTTPPPNRTRPAWTTWSSTSGSIPHTRSDGGRRHGTDHSDPRWPRTARDVVRAKRLARNDHTRGEPIVSLPSATPVADPLVGEWRQDFSCEDNVETFHRLALVDYDETFYRKWVRSDFVGSEQGYRDRAHTGGPVQGGARPLQDHESRGWIHHVVRVPGPTRPGTQRATIS